jgi:predicted Zn-dependent protease with MMP-like domain
MNASATRTFGCPPTSDDIAVLARTSLAALPEPFASHLRHVVLLVDEFADAETLAELGIDDPFDLSGVYHGVDIGRKSSTDSGALPDRITLYRRAILDEWAAGDVTLERLVHHILIHEVGHHFGLSDEDMHALEQDG